MRTSSSRSDKVQAMKTTTRRALIAPIAALSMTIALAACGSDDAADPASVDTSVTSIESPSPGQITPSETPTEEPPATSDAASDDVTATALTAIATAEAAAGGQAYEIDDQDDDGTWEVDVRVGNASVEVTVSADGTEVVEQENDDLDDDDRNALDAASITLTQAIQIAIDEVGGVLDDAELEDNDDGKPYHWEVSIDIPGNDDVEVLVSIDGQIIEIDS